MPRVPLVVVTGFLGAGKTTLVNRLLARRAERGDTAGGKLGVIVNELGAIGIDGSLLGGDAKQVELPGGCVCCVLGDELDQTLIELVDGNPALAAIVLETTGVAEPLPIVWAVQRAEVARRVRLAAVVTVVDAAQFRAARPQSIAVDTQIANADVILVTKEPIAGAAEAEAALAAVRELAPRALVRRGSTDDHAAWLEQVLADPDLERTAAGAPHDHDDHDDHAHDGHVVETAYVEIPGRVDLEELEDQLGELPASYIRIKGIAFATDGRAGAAAAAPRWVAVHRVGLRVSSEPLARAPAGYTAEHGKLVALGRGLQRDVLAACVTAALEAA